MKRLLSFILIACVLICICGCKQETQKQQGSPFYYCVRELDFHPGSAALAVEYRADVPQNTLIQAIEIYLNGPLSPDLQSPFPEDLRLIGVYQEDETIYMTFSPELSQLSGLELTMVCGCVTLTVLSLTDAKQAEIRSVTGLLDGQRSIIMDKDTLLLLDSAANE